MAKWRKEVFRLPENHGWQVKEGFKSFVADHGAVRFDVPAEWVFVPGDNSVKFYDREPPNDTCLLETSIFRLPEGVDWTRLPLSQLLAETLAGDRAEILTRGAIVAMKRGDLELAWSETRYVDPEENREARSRCCLARRALVQPLLTLAFWPEDAARAAGVWDEVLASLRIGDYVTPPLQRGRN
jgi:hypothetical protein